MQGVDVICPVCSERVESAPIFCKSGMPCYVLERHYTRESALAARTGNVDFRFCGNCGFVFNAAFSPALMDYVVDYESSRTHSPYFEHYLEKVCKELSNVCSVAGKTVAEIGCGDGHFLMKLRELVEFEGWGFEPSLNRVNNKPAYKDLTFVADYYDWNILGKKPDLIILRHILEHQSHMHDFLNGILGGVKNAPHQIYIEIPAWEWIVAHDQVYAFSYEHCSYYTKNSLQRIMTEYGYTPRKIAFSFKDEYIQYFGGKDTQVVDNNRCLDQDAMISVTRAFIERIPIILARLQTLFANASDTVLWGAAGKGTTLLNILDIDYGSVNSLV